IAYKMILALKKRLVLAWIFSIPVSYVCVGFFDLFYISPFEISLLNVLIHTFVILFTYYLLGKIKRDYKSTQTQIGLMLFLVLSIFLIRLILIANRFPSLFDIHLYRIRVDLVLWFSIGTFISIFTSHWLLDFLILKRFNQTRFYSFIEANLHGILIASVFFFIYVLLSNIFNQPLFNFDDIFFDTDARLYRARFG